MKVFVIGFMGSGKTAIGERLSQHLDFTFIDLDREIEKSQRMPVDSIFGQFGEQQFRKWEREELLRVLANDDCVIATGGGTACFFDNMEVMNREGETIYIRLSVEDISASLKKSNYNRPLLKGKSEPEMRPYIEQLLMLRERFYNRAKIVANGPDVRVSELAARLADGHAGRSSALD